MGKYTIHVSADHINNSDRGEARSCMVANALRDQLDLPSVVIETSYRSTVIYKEGPRGGKGKRIGSIKHRDLADKITDFDSGFKTTDGLNPFDFEIEFPDDWREKLRG